MAYLRKKHFKSFRMLFQILPSYNSDRASTETPARLFCSVKMVNILENRPFLTMKGLTHGPKILARKSSNVALDSS